MNDLVARLRAQPTERTYDSVGRAYDFPKHLIEEAASRISQQDAELERMRREVEEANAKIAKTRDLIAWAQSDLIAEARKAAFIEAAEIAEETAQGSDHLLKAAGQAKDIQGALVHGEGVMTARIIATALRRKAEGRP